MTEPASPRRCLFIGNSHTYYNDMPDMVKAMYGVSFLGSKDTPAELFVRDTTAGGVDFEWHWENRASHAALDDGPWDWVVLQERSGGPLENPRSSRAYAGKWIEAIRNKGATPFLYMTWAGRARPRTIEKIAGLYESIGAEHGVTVAPAGRAWDRSLKARKDLGLHDADGRHANLAGSYLAACCIFKTLAGRSPVGLWTPDGIGESDAEHLQSIAAAT